MIVDKTWWSNSVLLDLANYKGNYSCSKLNGVTYNRSSDGIFLKVLSNVYNGERGATA